jgi:hypothetical protein
VNLHNNSVSDTSTNTHNNRLVPALRMQDCCLVNYSSSTPGPVGERATSNLTVR